MVELKVSLFRAAVWDFLRTSWQWNVVFPTRSNALFVPKELHSSSLWPATTRGRQASGKSSLTEPSTHTDARNTQTFLHSKFRALNLSSINIVSTYCTARIDNLLCRVDNIDTWSREHKSELFPLNLRRNRPGHTSPFNILKVGLIGCFLD